MLQKIKNKKGFTLIELMITIVIIMILFSIIVPAIFEITTNRNSSTTEIEIITQEEENKLETPTPKNDTTPTPKNNEERKETNKL